MGPTDRPTDQPTNQPTTNKQTNEQTNHPTNEANQWDQATHRLPAYEASNERAYLATCLPTYLPACLPTYLPTHPPTNRPVKLPGKVEQVLIEAVNSPWPSLASELNKKPRPTNLTGFSKATDFRTKPSPKPGWISTPWLPKRQRRFKTQRPGPIGGVAPEGRLVAVAHLPDQDADAPGKRAVPVYETSYRI